MNYEKLSKNELEELDKTSKEMGEGKYISSKVALEFLSRKNHK